MTDQYPVCPQGSEMQRVFDFPSCWNGKDLDSEDHTEHLRYPDESGECSDDEVPVPALRITVNYDPPPGRSFAIDSFPEQQHDPVTDHALLEYLSSKSRAQAGADCINSARRCSQGSEDDAAGPTGTSDQVTTSKNFAHLMATHTRAQGGGMPMGGIAGSTVRALGGGAAARGRARRAGRAAAALHHRARGRARADARHGGARRHPDGAGAPRAGDFVPMPEDRLVLEGLRWGILATAVYDVFRLDTVAFLGLVGRLHPHHGHLADRRRPVVAGARRGGRVRVALRR